MTNRESTLRRVAGAPSSKFTTAISIKATNSTDKKGVIKINVVGDAPAR
jgi:hypothetical protein